MDPDSYRTISQDLNGDDNVFCYAVKPIWLNAIVSCCSYRHRKDHRLSPEVTYFYCFISAKSPHSSGKSKYTMKITFAHLCILLFFHYKE